MPLFVVDMSGVITRQGFNRHRLRGVVQQLTWKLPSATTFIIDPNRLGRLLYCCCNHFIHPFRQSVKTIVLNAPKSDSLNLNNLYLFRKCIIRDLTVFGNLHRGQVAAICKRPNSNLGHTGGNHTWDSRRLKDIGPTMDRHRTFCDKGISLMA